RRRELRRANAIVLGIAPSGAGELHYWRSDGRLIPLGYGRALRELAAAIQKPRAQSGRGETPAFAGRALGLPAIAIGRLDERGVAPRSHQPTDLNTAIDETALENTTQFALVLVDAINASLAAAQEPSPTPA
ncbi:MAG TPA: hypothetical protein VIH85_07200, partial [Solirubrobacteraceae bacterium]